MSGVFFVAAALLFCGAASAKTVVIYHTSDVHGRYASVNGMGGYPALAAQAKKEKAPVMFLDSGDWFIGTREGAWTRGAASIAMMNAVGYSAAVPGNHDFDYGQDNLRALLSSATFIPLAANIKKDGKLVSYVKPYHIFEAGGVRIAVIGLANHKTGKLTLPGYVKDIVFGDEVTALKAVLPRVLKEKPNAVILLVHDGILTGERLDGASLKPSKKNYANGTLALAKAGGGKVQVILGGHRHTLLLNGFRDPRTATLIGETGHGFGAATRIELSFDDTTGRFNGAKNTVVELDTAKTGEDETVLAAYRPIKAKADEAMSLLLGQSADVLSHKPVKAGEGDSPLGNLLCDIIRSYAKTQLAVQNSNGMDADIKAGPVTIGSIYDVIRYENSLVTEELSGAQLEAMMLESLAGKSPALQVSGMEVVSVGGADGKAGSVSITIEGKPLNSSEYYSVATNNYLANGTAYSGSLAAGRNPHDTMIPVRDMVIEGIKSYTGPLTAPPTGRILKGK